MEGGGGVKSPFKYLHDNYAKSRLIVMLLLWPKSMTFSARVVEDLVLGLGLR